MKIGEIANILNISKSTVSLAMNNKPGVSPKTREKVMNLVRQSGYIPRHMIKADQYHGVQKTIKFISCLKSFSRFTHYQQSSFFMGLIHGIEKECSTLGYNLMFLSIDANLFDKEIKRLESEPSSIYILLGTYLNPSELKLAAEHLPNLVVLDTFYEFMDLNFIVMNNAMGSYGACMYLIDLGHRHIGYVQAKDRLGNMDHRKRGFMSALEERELDIKDSDFFSVSIDTKAAESDFKQIIQNFNHPMPTALFCENDYIAIGVIKALKEFGKDVPGDISVIGFDNVPECTLISPELTTVHVEKEKMGIYAVREALQALEQKDEKKVSSKLMIDTSLVIRSTCRKI